MDTSHTFDNVYSFAEAKAKKQSRTGIAAAIRKISYVACAAGGLLLLYSSHDFDANQFYLVMGIVALIGGIQIFGISIISQLVHFRSAKGTIVNKENGRKEFLKTK